MGAPGGSTLGALAARREALMKQRKALTGGADRGAPQAPTRANPNPPPPPQAPAQAAPATERRPAQAAPQEGAAGGREGMRAQAETFLREVGSQMQGQVAPPKEPAIRDESVRQDQTTTLRERVGQLGATDRSLESQFYRLAGRMGSPRELSMLASRLELERQLKRPPTQTEFKNFIAQPSSLGPLFSPAVERAPSATQQGG